MKGGKVVRLRINPQDCMGVADTLEKLGVTSERFSFDQAVRVALSSLLESARAHGAIPRRDGFEYTKMMERFVERMPQDRALKLAVTELMDKSTAMQVKPLVPDVAKERRRIRYEELKTKKLGDDLNWTDAEQAELVSLMDEFYQF